MFWLLLLNGWRFAEEIVEEFTITRTELTLARRSWSARASSNGCPASGCACAWRRTSSGARAAHEEGLPGQRVTAEFLRSRFDGPLELLRFEARDLSPESAAVLRRRLERLVAEFGELAEVDSSLPPRRREGRRVLRRLPPWDFSAVNALKKRPGDRQRSNRA